MGLERDMQTEVYRTFNQFGWGMKMQADASVCNYCHKVNRPVHVGMPDYHFEIQGRYYSIGGHCQVMKVEVKAGKDRFEFSELRKDQREWLDDYNKKFGSHTTWLWIQLGTEPVNSNSTFARQAYLMTYEQFLQTEKEIIELGVHYMPADPTTQSAGRLKTAWHANAFEMWEYQKLDWLGDRRWIPPQKHYFWDAYAPQFTYKDIRDGRNFFTTYGSLERNQDDQ